MCENHQLCMQQDIKTDKQMTFLDADPITKITLSPQCEWENREEREKQA